MPRLPAPRTSPSSRPRWGGALIHASAHGDVEKVTELLEKGAPVDARNRVGETALACAAAWDRLPVVKLLLKHRADPNVADRTGGTALMIAAQHASAATVRELLRHGADTSARDRAGNTVLMHAGWRPDPRERPAVLRLLKSATQQPPRRKVS